MGAACPQGGELTGNASNPRSCGKFTRMGETTNYHLLVTQMFTSSLLLMRAGKVAPDARFLQRLGLMYRMMDELASPSGHPRRGLR